jgi:N-acetyl-gamma-glutamyl-phosphate reductase
MGAKPVAVLGASGYTGAELLRLLATHPEFEVAAIGASSAAGDPVTSRYPHLDAYSGRSFEDLKPETVAGRAEVALFALPHGEAASVAPTLLEAGLRVVDLSGDFRLPADAYPSWYGYEHPSSAWLEKAVYGLPELFAGEIRDAALVANPGCYPTAVLLGLLPLAKTGLIETGGIVIDAKSGVSGAGRTPSDSTHFATADGSVRPYKAGGVHQHTPEIERYLSFAAGGESAITFVPHLVPTTRGVLTTSYVKTTSDAASLLAELNDAYSTAPFVRVLPEGTLPDSKRLQGSNVCELGVAVDGRTGTAIVIGAVDNLVKGAAGQAIQNLNIMLGLPETTGLEAQAVYP